MARSDARDSVLWWAATWVLGVLAGSFVAAALYAPERPAGLGDVLHPPIGVLAASLVGLWSVYLAGVWSWSQRLGSARPFVDVGASFRAVDLLGVPLGVAAQLALMPLVYLPLRAAWGETFSDDRLEDTARDLVDRADGPLIVLLVVLVVFGAPVVEELFFRGMLQRPLLAGVEASRSRSMIAVVAVAAVFAMVHFRPVEFPGLFAFGLVLGAAAWSTGRLGMPILAHVAFNATGIVTVL